MVTTKQIINMCHLSGVAPGEDGLDVYRRIIGKVDDFLKPDAALMLEIGYAQGPAIRELFEKADCFSEITIEEDIHDNDRIAIARKMST